ncbi:cell division protein ZipA C-terminal FtsZ-binding domain-containing protein [Bacterioplanoides sp.]|uniref:cell division protein ZipA C-terminal FtsZ-binding domain-containing protein n=1 Tax=Bacterioplanoides sp. TaxID=2066072 RepID=UPI003B5A048A
MEWSWRTVLILIGLVAMVAILIDGFRRMRRARAEALRLDVSEDFKFPEEGYNPELPGEVRVVGGIAEQAAAEPPPERPELQKSEPSLDDIPAFTALEDERETVAVDIAINREDISAASATTSEAAVIEETAVEASKEADDQPSLSVDSEVLSTDQDAVAETSCDDKSLAQPNSPLIPKAKPVNLDEQVPVLLDVEELGDDTDVVSDTVSDVASELVKAEAIAAEADTIAADSLIAEQPVSASETETEPMVAESAPDYVAELEDPQQIEDPHLELEAEPQQMAESFAETAQIITHPVNFAGADAEVLAHRPPAEVVLVIHAIAQSDEGFKGSDLIYLFNSCDLRYGEKNIFHRFEEADGAGNIQFSVSQSHEPGIFEPGKMVDQQFRGLSFFMSLPGAKRPLEAYEAMYEMAMVVARNLKADVLDESLSALTPQTVEANREEIMTFERHQHLMMKKQGTR